MDTALNSGGSVLLWPGTHLYAISGMGNRYWCAQVVGNWCKNSRLAVHLEICQWSDPTAYILGTLALELVRVWFQSSEWLSYESFLEPYT